MCNYQIIVIIARYQRGILTPQQKKKTFFNNWGVHEIQGVIYVDWALKKTELLKSCVQDMVSSFKKLKTVV